MPARANRISVAGSNSVVRYSSASIGAASRVEIPTGQWPVGLYVVVVELASGQRLAGKWVKTR
jgi:hypothetical protein